MGETAGRREGGVCMEMEGGIAESCTPPPGGGCSSPRPWAEGPHANPHKLRGGLRGGLTNAETKVTAQDGLIIELPKRGSW